MSRDDAYGGGDMTLKKTIATVATATLAFAGLTACGDSADQTVSETAETVATDATDAVDTAVSESVVTETVTDDDDADDADDASTSPAAAVTGTAGPDLPASVKGYSDEARANMAEDNITEADVEAVLAAALNGDAEVEWDDGIWEIEWQDIDIDINPGGVVLDADR